MARIAMHSKKGFIVAALAILLFLYSCFDLFPVSNSRELLFPAPWTNAGSASGPTTCPTSYPYQPHTPPSSTWRRLPVRHPAGQLLNLSRSAPATLRRVQFQFAHDFELSTTQIERRDAVKEVFVRCWASYKERAWLKDELSPISGGFNNRYGGWAATLVDNLDTLWIMNLTSDFDDAVDAALSIDFDDPQKRSQETISVFETTIRHLGGFLAAYEVANCRDVRLLDKAAEIGDMLLVSFDTPNRMPTNSWSPRKALAGQEQLPDSGDNILANLASLSLEFIRLSQLTGDMRYYSAVQGITNALADQQNKTLHPGMWPQRYDSSSLDFTRGSKFSLGAEADSAYEYLLKMVLLLGGNEQASQYEAMYKYAMETAIDTVLFRPVTNDNSDVLLSGKANPSFIPDSEHLACFTGGMFALGGRVLSNDGHVEIGRKLTEGCAWAYRVTASGIAPENYMTVRCESSTHCAWNSALWDARGGRGGLPKGFTAVPDGRYFLRPEALESMFYMYRVTGDTKYQDMAWSMFESVLEQTETEFGHAQLASVLVRHGELMDEMESFFMAELLKYMYLLFSDPTTVSLDDYVLSTEAHPFRIPKPG